VTAVDSFHQLRLKFTDPVQHDYEIIRPIVLFAESVAERSRELDIDRTVIGEKARRFLEKGMFGLVDQRTTSSGRKGHEYPGPIAGYILYLKELYPPIHYREIVRIIKHKFGYDTNHHTVKHFLDTHPVPVQLSMELDLEVPAFHEFEDSYQARYTVVSMYFSGWNKRSIAGLLHLSRRQVGRIIEAFERDGFEGLLDERTRPPSHSANQLTLPLLKEILEVQHEYPRAGRFRVKGLLAQRLEDDPPSEATIGRAMALNRQYHHAPGPWQRKQDDEEPDTTPKYLPYRPEYRHQLWYIDIRYLVKLASGWVYSVCVIEGYSRKILAGMASEYQDLVAVLQILRASLIEYGCPEAIVSDNGSVFEASTYDYVLRTLNIRSLQIEKGKPWQNLIEAQFKIQLRLADHNFERAATLEEVQDYHAEFVETFNTTPHWAHRERLDARRTPADVLKWVRGRTVDLAQLQRLFRHLQFTRTVNQFGFVSVQRFYIYAERGLSRQRVSVWIYEGRLHIEYQQTQLARYAYKYDRKQKRLTEVSEPTLYQTEFQSPQLEILELDDAHWLKVRPRPYQPRPKFILPDVEQLPLWRLALWAAVPLGTAIRVGNYFFPNMGHFL
jgi:transposase InsO family protein